MIDLLEVVEPVINFRKVKYDLLGDLIRQSGMTGGKLNMFINLDTILDKFYSNDTMSAFKSLKGKELIILTSEIFNLIAHYRNYFWTRHRVSTSFYIYNLNMPVMNCKNDEYLSSKLNRKQTEHINFGVVNYVFNKNMELISGISKYIKQCYYIPSNGLEPSLIPYYIINKYSNNNDVCNLILTSDKSEYSLMSLENTFILKASGKNSTILSKDNIYDYKFKNIKYRPKIELSDELYPLILSMSGYKDRNINGVYGFTKAYKIVESAVKDSTINNSYLPNPKVLRQYIDDNDLEQIVENYKCIDVRRHHRLMNDVDEIRIENKIIDRYDNGALIHLNSKYFETNNIQLVELSKGV